MGISPQRARSHGVPRVENSASRSASQPGTRLTQLQDLAWDERHNSAYPK